MKIDIVKLFNLRRDSWDALEDSAYSMYMYVKKLNDTCIYASILREMSFYKDRYNPTDCDILLDIFLDDNRLEVITHNITTYQTVKRVIEFWQYSYRPGYYINNICIMLLDKSSGEFIEI